MDLFNRQLHPDEKRWINEKEASYVKKYGLTLEAARDELTTQANLQVQNGSPGQWNRRASEFLAQGHGLLPVDRSSGPGYMFYATPEQKANTDMYARYYPGGVGMNAPTADDIANSASREQGYRDAYAKGTWGAATGDATVAIAGPVTMIAGAPLLSTNGVLGSSTWASPLGAGTISATTNAVVQYLQNDSVNWLDVAGSFGTGYAGSVYAGLVRNVGVNILGGATTTALNNILEGKNDSVLGAAVVSGTLSGVGYGIGKASESGINALLKPGLNTQNWVSTGVWSGSGWNLFNPNNLAPVGGAVGGGAGQELINGMHQKVQSKNGPKK